MEEERHNWIVNTKVLYNFISCISLPHQPLSVEFLPPMPWKREPLEDVSFQYLACGLQEEPEDRVSLYLIEVAMPTQPLVEGVRCYSKCIDYEGFPIPNYREPMYQCVSKGELSGDINRIRSHAYEGRCFLSAKSTDVHVYEVHQGIKEDEDLKPCMTFSDHEKEGYGLSFHKGAPFLGSCSDDGIVNIWDLSCGQRSYTYRHNEGLNCIEFLYGSNRAIAASEDGTALIIDSNQPDVAAKTPKVEGAVNAVSCHCVNTDIFATGSTSGMVYLWDYRNMSKPYYDIKAHEGAIVRLHFNNTSTSLLATASEDSTICVFDLADDDNEEDDDMGAEEEQTPDDLIFTHTGHMEQIYDFCWSKEGCTETFIASAGEDYCLQLWQLTDDVLDYGDDMNNDNET